MGKRFIIDEEEEDVRCDDEKKVKKRGMSKSFLFVGIASVVFMMSMLFLYLKEGSDEMNDLLKHRGSSNTFKKSHNHLRFDKNSMRLKLKQNSIDQCSVFYAESSVPNGGMGIYTTIPRQAGDQLLISDGPSIPVIDADYSNKSKKAWIKLFQSYWWGNGQSDVALFEGDEVVEYQTGAGGLPNSHAYINNIQFEDASVVPYDDSLLDRTKDPGAGANSYFIGRKTMTREDVEAGEELFMRYPAKFMNQMSEKYNIPRRGDFDIVGEAVLKLVKIYGKDVKRWKDDGLISLIPDRATSLLPKTQAEMENVLARKDIGMGMAIAKEVSLKKRSVEWIKENGVCMDNFAPFPSTNKRAGHGAIAKRWMMEGDVVGLAPILHVSNRDVLRIPAFTGDEWQLILNYCIGHKHSSLLLCPNTNVNWVNHCSTRKPDEHPCGSKGSPNAEYRFASWNRVNKEWMNKTVSEIEKEQVKGLYLELVATRDIEVGEEIFIDYGEDFEKAWTKHVKKWEPSPHEKGSKPWVNLKELNDKTGPLDIAPSFDEKYSQDGDIITVCFYRDLEGEAWEEYESEEWKAFSKKKLIKKYGDEYAPRNFSLEKVSNHFWPCVVGEKGDDDNSYHVRILQSPYQEETEWAKKGLPRILINFPRESIRFFYRPYHSDVHLKNAFRHHIGLKEGMFPKKWMNRKSKKEKKKKKVNM